MLNPPVGDPDTPLKLMPSLTPVAEGVLLSWFGLNPPTPLLSHFLEAASETSVDNKNIM